MDIETKISDLLDDLDFQAIDRRMARFNLFEAVGAVRGELRHSNFLGFLLSPSRSHGFGALALRQILRAVLTKIPHEQRPLRALELVLGDLENAVVYREWNNIDLLIVITKLSLVVTIENKIDSKDGDGQLSRYKQITRAKHPGQRHLFVFLTPEGADPDDREYVSLSYAELAKIIESLSQGRNVESAPDASIIIRHYVEMLRRHIVPDEELHELARQVYERYKEAFDFIFESRPEPESLLGVARELLESEPTLIPDRHAPKMLRFFPDSWKEIKELNCGDAWTRTGRNVLFQLENQIPDRVVIALYDGPAPAAIRERLYSGATARPDLFRGLVKSMGKQWARIYMRELLTPAAAANMDIEEKTVAVQAGWNSFMDDLPLLAAAVIEIVNPDQNAGPAT